MGRRGIIHLVAHSFPSPNFRRHHKERRRQFRYPWTQTGSRIRDTQRMRGQIASLISSLELNAPPVKASPFSDPRNEGRYHSPQ